MKISVQTMSATLTVCLISGLSTFAQDTFTPIKTTEDVPQTVTDLWKDYDPRAEDLDVKVIKEWKAEGVVTRYITFKVGTFKGADSRIAAYYSFPDNGKKNPAFVWCHGGGQRADRTRGLYFAKQGFATVDINWGGKPMEPGIQENTDWGNVDATQGPRFYSKALRKTWKMDLQPDEFSIDPVPSARNSNWFLLAVAAKRAITFLEQQPEVRADCIGFAGFSMGGQTTSLAAIDPRLKAVAPFVGGTGFRHVDFPGGIEGSSFRRQYSENLTLYENTLDSMAYWPRVKCPVIFLSSSNDFNAALDRAYQAMALLNHNAWRVSTNIHENHSPGPEQWALLIKWFNQYLKGVDQKIPETPPATFVVNGQTARFTVSPDKCGNRLLETEIYYSYDPNAYTRFWKRADAVKSTDSWSVDLSVHENLPVYVFALCRYSLGKAMETLKGSTSTITVNSIEHAMVPQEVDLTALATLKKDEAVFEDFSNGLRDWAIREKGRMIRTRKFQNPELDVSNDKKLLLRIDPGGRKLSLRLSTGSRFLSSELNQGSFSASRNIEGNGPQDVVIARDDFHASGKGKGKEAEELQWARITLFDLVILDAATKEKVDLTSEEGRGILKSITLVE
jgi:dienelactone hydrolase